MVRGYPRLGHEGEVVTLDDPAAPHLQDLGFPVHALGPVQTKFGYTPRLIPWLRAHRQRFDGVIVHGLWQYGGFAVRRAMYGHLPYMVFAHGMLDPYFKHASKLKHFKKWLYWILVEYWVLREAKRVLFTSGKEADLAKQSFWLHHWDPQVVSYGATGPEGDPECLRQVFLAQHASLQDAEGKAKPFLLFLGRIHPKKGCDLLLDAFARVAETIPDLQLVFAGPDAANWQTKLVTRAAECGIGHRIHWTGMLEGDMKWGAMYACEAFVLPSHQENFGIAVAEALACSKPVLISNKVNIWERILQDGAAIVAEDNNAGALELLERWISLNPSERAVMGQCALQCFRLHYDIQKNIGSIICLFSGATTGSNKLK